MDDDPPVPSITMHNSDGADLTAQQMDTMEDELSASAALLTLAAQPSPCVSVQGTPEPPDRSALH